MSCSALRQASGIRNLCQGCRERKALFQYRGVVRADRDHTLCFACYRSERDRQRSRRLSTVDSRLSTRPSTLDRRLWTFDFRLPPVNALTSPVTAPS